MNAPANHWRIVVAWLAGIAMYLIAIGVADETAERWINNGAWTLASLAAMASCYGAARRLEGIAARSWWLMFAACTSWFIGQLIWNYKQFASGHEAPFLGIGQVFYSFFPLLIIVAVSQLPEARQGAIFRLKQFGNVALVLCCLAMTVVLGLIEPAERSGAPRPLLWLAGFQIVTIASAFLFSLYTLWTYRWAATWSVMVKIVVSMGIYAASTLIYIRALMLGSYLPGDAINAGWLLLFGLISWAAAERSWLAAHPTESSSRRLLRRERWLEAVVPALLIIIMIAVGISSASTLTPRVLVWTAVLFILFAIILGIREALIQSDTQRLNNDLMEANRRLNEANTDLRDSEVRYRDLNAALERRVDERTAQLKRAYGELEAFSYAVAHDLKSPLRAIDGFAHLLRETLGYDASPETQAHLKRIRGGASKMAALIDDLLSYANIERRQLRSTQVELPSLVQSVIDECAVEIESRGVRLTQEVEPLMLFVDTDGLTLALRNLIGNSIKYTGSIGSPRIDVIAKHTESGVLITVRDNGIGFDMQFHDRIFNVFQRLHRDEQYPGTGIGLALVRKAAERMGGRVWAQSAPNEGATFFLELPASVLLIPAAPQRQELHQ